MAKQKCVSLTIREPQILCDFVKRLVIEQPHMILGLECRIGLRFAPLLGVHIVGDRLKVLARFVDRLEEQVSLDVRPADFGRLRLDGRFLGAG